MPRKKNQNIPDASPTLPDNLYITWDDENLEDKRQALAEAAKGLDDYGIVQKSVAYNRGFRMSWEDVSSGPTSGRRGLTQADYYAFRPEEAPPVKIKPIFAASENIYNKVGLVKNVIDLMADFGSQGIRLVHRNKRIERFYRNWFNKVSGQDRSERFLNNLYRVGNVVINRQTAKITNKAEKELYKAAGADINLAQYPECKVEKKEIPWRYTFIDPLYVEVNGGSLSSFVGEKTYSIVIPGSLRKTINSPKNEYEKRIVSQLPEAIIKAAQDKTLYPLDSCKTLVFHYKKDDWQTWAYPMIYSIMDDIAIVEKLKLADMAALDGAISNIRIFKLGNLEHKIAPTQAAANKLSSILQNNVGGGTMDLVWGPDIELLESKTNVHQFLGESKYVPHLNSIYAGLGIPPTLTGTFGAAGTTNNFISLKTLTKRLEYGREVLRNFWMKEIEMVQKAMGFRYPAQIEFDRMDLSNEDAEKALLIQLSDRNIISNELVQESFGFNPDIEKSRLNRESKERESDRMVEKAGPYYDTTYHDSIRKMALQLGLATPSQVGLELEKKKNGEMNAIEVKTKFQPPKPSPIGNPANQNAPKPPQQNGRPKNQKDTKQRKQRDFKPQTGASICLWSMEAQDKITAIVNPILLDFYQKKNMRSLSSAEYNESEAIKTKLLFSIEPFKNISQEVVLEKLNTINSIDIQKNYSTYKVFAKEMASKLDRQLTAEENKFTKSYVYELVYNNK